MASQKVSVKWAGQGVVTIQCYEVDNRVCEDVIYDIRMALTMVDHIDAMTGAVHGLAGQAGLRAVIHLPEWHEWQLYELNLYLAEPSEP